MTTNQEEGKFNTEIAILPMASIVRAVGLQANRISAYEQARIVKPKIKNEKKYYSLNDLERLRFANFLIKNKIMKFSGVIILFSILAKTNIEPSDYLKYAKKIIKTKNLKVS